VKAINVDAGLTGQNAFGLLDHYPAVERPP
jgi:hypothetical protein